MPKRVKMIKVKEVNRIEDIDFYLTEDKNYEIEVYDNQVDHYLLLGFSLFEKEKKDTRPIVENQLEEEETTFIEE